MGGDGVELTYQVTGGQGPVSSRDFVLVFKSAWKGDTFVQAGRSVDIPDAPPGRQDGVPLADGLRVQGDDSDRDPQHGHANRPARLCGLRQGLGQDSLISLIYPY